MHTRRLFNVFLAGLLVPFVGCDNVPEPKTWIEEDGWERFVHRQERATNAVWSKSAALGLNTLTYIKKENPNAVCPFGEYRGQHVDALIQMFKEKVAEQEDAWRYR